MERAAMNVHSKTMTWVKPAAVHCLMEVPKPPNAPRTGAVIPDTQWLFLLREASVTTAFFPTGRCTPVLLTSSEALSGVHYVLLDAVDAS